jgi:NAD(P)H-hydrate epimerase
MHVLSTAQIRLADAHTIAQQHISSDELMERAAKVCTEWLLKHMPREAVFGILCGPGNNGGDGWAIARMLRTAGRKVIPAALPAEKFSNDNSLNRERFLDGGGTSITLNTENLEQLSQCTVLVDALLGSGLDRALNGNTEKLVAAINQLAVLRIAIDAPTGFFCDTPMPDKAIALQAHYTLCFQTPRLMYLFADSQRYVGSWQVLNIGLEYPESAEFKEDDFSKFHYSLQPDLQRLMRRKTTFAHKGTNGHALIAGASHGKTGAVVLAARACLRSGAGLCSTYVPKEAYSILQSSVPEAMVYTSEEEQFLSGSFNPERFSAIAFGPGAGMHEDTGRVLKHLLQNSPAPLVIDADGLNILAENPTWLAFLPPNTILTPHPGELDRMCGKTANAYERWENARELSRKTGAIVVLKGAYTAVCSPNGEVYFNSTGNPGMAKGGSGDVLTGMICALLAQGYPALDAALLAVFVHGMSGDIAAEKMGHIAMHAGDLVECLPMAWKSME